MTLATSLVLVFGRASGAVPIASFETGTPVRPRGL